MLYKKITKVDLNEIRELQPPDWDDIIPDIEFYINSSFCEPIKATIDNIIVGIGTKIVFENTAWIAHIIVRNEYRNNGIGFQIVNHLLDTLKKQYIQTCSLIATSLGKPVYAKAGFKVASEYFFFKREKPWIESDFSNKIIPFDEKYRNAIYDLDREISGENREILLEAFAKKSILYVSNNIVEGYYLPDLKEGLIFAINDEAGLELMKLKYSKTDKAVLPFENISGREFLLNNGFAETSIGTRMIIGKYFDYKPNRMYSRIGGNFG